MSKQFSSTSKLGTLLSSHGISKSSRNMSTILGVGWVILLCTSIGVSISVFITSYTETNNPVSALFIPLCCVGTMAMPGAIILYQQWWSGVHGVAFYDLGLAIHTRKGKTDIPWDEIDSIWLEWGRSGSSRISSATNKTYTFRLKNQEIYRLRNNLEGFNQFDEKFYKPAGIAIEKRRIEDLQRGKRVTVVGIGIDNEGLSYGKKSIRWDEMEALRADKTQLLIKQNGQWKVWEIFAFMVPKEVLDYARKFINIE